jgi:hypothetical protein
MAPAPSALFAAASHFVHGSPGAPLSFFFGDPALLIPLFTVLGLAFLFFGMLRLISSWYLLALLVV